jgi:hypothetical protein
MVGAPPHPAKLAAIAAGKKTYSTGVPCPNGHLAPRNVYNGNCRECAAGNTWMRLYGGTRAEFEAMREAKRNGTYRRPCGVRQRAAEKRENKLPMLGTADNELTMRKLIKANWKFLKLLYMEKLDAVRSGIA